MNCPCGGLAPGRDYYPVGGGLKVTTYECRACGRRRVEVRDLDGKLLSERG